MLCPKCKNTMEEQTIKAPKRTPFGLIDMVFDIYLCKKCGFNFEKNQNQDWFVNLFRVK